MKTTVRAHQSTFFLKLCTTCLYKVRRRESADVARNIAFVAACPVQFLYPMMYVICAAIFNCMYMLSTSGPPFSPPSNEKRNTDLYVVARCLFVSNPCKNHIILVLTAAVVFVTQFTATMRNTAYNTTLLFWHTNTTHVLFCELLHSIYFTSFVRRCQDTRPHELRAICLWLVTFPYLCFFWALLLFLYHEFQAVVTTPIYSSKSEPKQYPRKCRPLPQHFDGQFCC